ncbi:MAG: RNA polymerase subunit sigma [Acidimicrobiia bacterium]|nr:RNA polymerase subunit sigma [Acidimicrobiia bacterium]
MTIPRPDTRREPADGRRGGRNALEELTPLVYDEMRRVAASLLRRERPGLTLQPTALVNEVYLRLHQSEGLAWENRAHFFGIAARAMREILVERARARAAAKRGGGRVQVTLHSQIAGESPASVELADLDRALTRLGALDPDLERLVDLRFFAGLSIDETAEVLDTSPATTKRRWALARAWLARALREGVP